MKGRLKQDEVCARCGTILKKGTIVEQPGLDPIVYGPCCMEKQS